MAENLIEALVNQLGGPILHKIAAMLGLDVSQARSAVTQSAATVLAGLLQQSKTPSGAESLTRQLKQGGFDGSLLDNLDSTLESPDKVEEIQRKGSNILDSIFGERLGSILNLLAGQLGLNKNAAGSLLGMIAPLVMSQLGKLVLGKGLGAGGLADLLKGQLGSLQGAAPPGLSSAIGVNSLADLGGDALRVAGDYGREAARAGAAYADDAARTGRQAVAAGSSMASWLVPLLLLGAIGLGLLYYLWPRNPAEQPIEVAQGTQGTGPAPAPAVNPSAPITPAPAPAEPGAGTLVETVKTRATGALEQAKAQLASVSLPNGLKIDVPRGGALERFATFLGSPNPDLTRTFTLDMASFEPDSTNVSPSFRPQIEALAVILKAFPSVAIKLIGYTDSSGTSDEQQARSTQLATTVKESLTEQGIDPTRIAVEGRGAEEPVASEDTEEGRQKDSRVVLAVTKLN
jgi:outer membrane protein OmpA-like peptidoglycan-associated protein